MRTTPASLDKDHDPDEGVGENGVIVTGVRRDRVPSDFEPVIQDAVALLQQKQGNPSLYVYGSVATGKARIGRSDVDLVMIGLDRPTTLDIGRQLTTKYRDLCRGVEIGTARFSDYDGVDDEAYGNRLFLRHYCAHVYGPDLRSNFPEFQADAKAARGLNGDIGRCAGRWDTAASAGALASGIGRRMARKTLLAVAGLVSVHDATWTTDRDRAAHRWGIIKPRMADGLRTLVNWSKSFDGEMAPAEIQFHLSGVVADVVKEFRHRVGLWGAG